MKLITLMMLMSALSVSCGNPHVSRSGSGTERATPPVTTDDDGETEGGEAGGSTGESPGDTSDGTTDGSTGGSTCVPNTTRVTDYKLYFGANNQGAPAEYVELTKCRITVNEDFNSKADGFSSLISNSNDRSFSYELIHQTEKLHQPEKVSYLEDIFGTETYSMELEKPVEQNGAIGKDRGVDSHSANRETKDALVWSFASPISFWGGDFLDVESSPSGPAKLRLYDCNKKLIRETNVVYPGLQQGQVESHFIGFIAPRKNICHVSLTVGDYERPATWTSRAFFRAIAVDGFNYGK